MSVKKFIIIHRLLNDEDEDVKDGILDTPTDKSARATEELFDSAQKMRGSLFASGKHLESVTPFGQRKNKFVVQFTLNEHPNIQTIKEEHDHANSEDDIIKRVQPNKRCSLLINKSHPKPGCRFMYDRIEDKVLVVFIYQSAYNFYFIIDAFILYIYFF